MSSVARRAKEDEVARGEDIEPTEGRRPARTCRSERSERQLALGLGVHSGAVDDGAVLRVVDHLLLGEGIADDVLGDAFKPGGIVTPQRLAVVYAKARRFPKKTRMI